MPALILGRSISAVVPSQPDDLWITFRHHRKAVRWSRQPNVFSKARQLGFNTALIGWCHPYCRILNDSLTQCFWEPSSIEIGDEYGSDPGILEGVLDSLERELLVIPYLASSGIIDPLAEVREQTIDAFLELRKRALEAVSRPELGLVLVHLPVPHPPGIYRRDQALLTTDRKGDYLDNLALADRTLGELRGAMEAAGVWNTSAVLVSSDHPWRTAHWRANNVWSAEESAACRGKEYSSVPFLLKLAGQQQGAVYDRPFNTVVTSDLILALLRGEISSAEQLAGWLDQGRIIVRLHGGHRGARPAPNPD
jgi:hypothetical protein